MNIKLILDKVAKRLGYISYEKYNEEIKFKDSKILGLNKKIDILVSKLGGQLSELIKVSMKEDFKNQRYAVQVEIEFSQLYKLYDTLGITNHLGQTENLEYEFILEGLFHEIRNNFDALLRMK